MQADIIIQTAMRCEAEPLIEYFNLKKDLTYTKFEVYYRDRIKLIISGIGKLKAAAAITHILTRNSIEKSLVLNIGIAGSPSAENKIGEIFLVNQVLDEASGRKYYPDLFTRHTIRETSLTTFDRAVEKGAVPADFEGLVDMEAAGFMAAVQIFMFPHQSACLKIVSDHLDFSGLNREMISMMIKNKLQEIQKVVVSYDKAVTQYLSVEKFDGEEYNLICETLKLTEAQRHILLPAFSGWCAKEGNNPSSLKKYNSIEIKNKNHRTTIFNELLADLGYE